MTRITTSTNTEEAIEENPPRPVMLPAASENGNYEGRRLDSQSDEDADLLDLRGILEAILFVSGEPISLEKLGKILEEFPKARILEALKHLQRDYAEEGRGVELAEIAGGYMIVTRRDLAPWIKRLKKDKAQSKLSRSALETLAIVGYKQPITRQEIEKIRGVETSSVLRTLLEQKLIRIVGRQDVPGRPILYGTTKHFLQRFGLRDLRDLPPLREIQDLGTPDQPLLPLEADSVSTEPAEADGIASDSFAAPCQERPATESMS